MMFRNLTMMRMAKYNKNATKIQSRWRGYYTRTYVHNYHRRKQYLQTLSIKNEIARKEIEAQNHVNTMLLEQVRRNSHSFAIPIFIFTKISFFDCISGGKKNKIMKMLWL